MATKTPDIRKNINTDLKDADKTTIQQAGINPLNNKALHSKNALQQAPSNQYCLEIDVQVEKEVDGIGMGVLENGIPYLTQQGLANLCGVARSVIYTITQEWKNSYDVKLLRKDRNSFIKEYLFTKDYKEVSLYIATHSKGIVLNAYPDIVCMSIIEYYAFETNNKNDVALKNYRKLATYGLQKYIYDSLGYGVDRWQYHNDRIALSTNSPPDGYFIIFKEIAGLVVDLIKAELVVNDRTIPDISVGQTWSNHWKNKELGERFGERVKFEHNYPPYYRQAESNPQTPWAYPDDALPEFRRWFRHEYLLTKFPKYILTKAKLLPGGQEQAGKIASLYKPLVAVDK